MCHTFSKATYNLKSFYHKIYNQDVLNEPCLLVSNYGTWSTDSNPRYGLFCGEFVMFHYVACDQGASSSKASCVYILNSLKIFSFYKSRKQEIIKESRGMIRQTCHSHLCCDKILKFPSIDTRIIPNKTF